VDDRTRQVSRTQPDTARHPALPAVAKQRSADVQLRMTDAMIAFAGPPRFTRESTSRPQMCG
jgi:hypothetical protein